MPANTGQLAKTSDSMLQGLFAITSLHLPTCLLPVNALGRVNVMARGMKAPSDVNKGLLANVKTCSVQQRVDSSKFCTKASTIHS